VLVKVRLYDSDMTLTNQVLPSVAPAKPARTNAVLAVLSLAAFMASLDVFIVNVAFADIGRDFRGASLSNLAWVLNAYAIVYAALLVPLGRFADRVGRLRVFVAGLTLFTVASAACAASPDLWSLVSFRVLQAVGAAALTPTSLGLLVAATPPERRVRAVRLWAAIGGLAAAAGPVFGGLLVTASWRLVFLVNVPVGILAVIAALRVVPDSRDATVTRTPDVLGAVILTGSIGAVSLGLTKGGDWGWGSVAAIASFVVAVALGVWFGERSLHHHTPIVELALIKVRSFGFANLAMLTFSIGFAASLLIAILWMQDVWHYTALRTGLGIAPGPIMVPIVATTVARFGKRIPPGWLAAVGCLFFASGAVLTLSFVGPHPSYATAILPGWIVGGIGVGLALPTLLSTATVDLPPARTSTGSGIINMTRQIGFVLGVSVLVAILGAPVGYAAAHHVFVDGWWSIAVVEVLAAVASLGLLTRRVRS
jgi:EmrB/QacA subfamily drug resistance transporter